MCVCVCVCVSTECLWRGRCVCVLAGRGHASLRLTLRGVCVREPSGGGEPALLSISWPTSGQYTHYTHSPLSACSAGTHTHSVSLVHARTQTHIYTYTHTHNMHCLNVYPQLGHSTCTHTHTHTHFTLHTHMLRITLDHACN